MPELPEVEVNRRKLLAHVSGALLGAPEIRHADVFKVLSPDLSADSLTGSRIEDIRRRGKYLIFFLSAASGKPEDDLILIVHFRMTGSLVFSREPVQDPVILRHAHAVLPLTDRDGQSAYLTWHDIRRFGRLELIQATAFQESCHSILKLGPEPDSRDMTAQYLSAQAVRHRQLSLPAFLLHQGVIAGLGNIYVNEALFAARLNPLLKAGSLSTDDYRVLLQEIRRILKRSIEAGGTTFRDYVNSEGGSGGNQKQLAVYGRSGKPCLRCGTALEHLQINGRRVVFCPTCQNNEGVTHMNFMASGYVHRDSGSGGSIGRFTFDRENGFRRDDIEFPLASDVSYIILDESRTSLIGTKDAADEGSEPGIFELRLDSPDDSLQDSRLGMQKPCHVCDWNQYIFAAHYGTGRVSVAVRHETGLVYLGDLVHRGSGPDKERQDAPHAHWVGVTADDRYLLTVDLGCDRVFLFDLQDLEPRLLRALDQEIDSLSDSTGAVSVDLNPSSPLDLGMAPSKELLLPAGCGPRHLASTSDGMFWYLTGELDGNFYALKYDNSELIILDSYDLKTSGSSEEGYHMAAVRVTADDRFVLASVRGSDMLWAFRISQEDGKLELASHAHCGGSWPRDFHILADGRTVIVACERAGKLTALDLDPETGQLNLLPFTADFAGVSCVLPL